MPLASIIDSLGDAGPLLAGAVAFALLFYLLYAIARPERF